MGIYRLRHSIRDTTTKEGEIMEQIQLLGDEECLSWLRRVRFVKDGVTYEGKLFWGEDQGYSFYPNHDSPTIWLDMEQLFQLDDETAGN